MIRVRGKLVTIDDFQALLDCVGGHGPDWLFEAV